MLSTNEYGIKSKYLSFINCFASAIFIVPTNTKTNEKAGVKRAGLHSNFPRDLEDFTFAVF